VIGMPANWRPGRLPMNRKALHYPVDGSQSLRVLVVRSLYRLLNVSMIDWIPGIQTNLAMPFDWCHLRTGDAHHQILDCRSGQMPDVVGRQSQWAFEGLRVGNAAALHPAGW